MTFLISFFKDWPVDCLLLLDCYRPRPDSSPEIGDCEIEHLASSATDDGLDHVEGEPLAISRVRFGSRCKSGNLLMADMDPLDLPLTTESVIPLRLSPTTP